MIHPRSSAFIGGLIFSASLHAAAVRGNVVTWDGGEPLSHTAVTLRPVPGWGGSTFNTKTDQFGAFEFAAVPAGAYLLSAARQYFVAAQYGQKRWNSAGLPLILDDTSSTSVSIRMHRFGGITGRVVDENDVGILAHEVAAYRNEQPLDVVAHATTDDYGRYRIYGLTPGTYLVRSAAKKVDGVGYMPTFAPNAKEVSQARSVDVQIDLDTPGVDVHPPQGRLVDIAGSVAVPDYCGPITLTLAGETGRQTHQVHAGFQFDAVAPGEYELYGEGPCQIPPADPRCPTATGYARLAITNDNRAVKLDTTCIRVTGFSYSLEGGGTINDKSGLALLARRKDLAGVLGATPVPNGVTAALLPAGRWEILLQTPPEYATVRFFDPVTRLLGTRPDAWHETLAGDNINGRPVYTGIKQFTLSTSPGSLRGVVTGTSHENVVGTPVYLEGYDASAKRRVTDVRVALTDTHGMYQFAGLTPGTYRVLATFEYQWPDAAAMDAAGATTITVEKGNTRTQDLDLFVLR